MGLNMSWASGINFPQLFVIYASLVDFIISFPWSTEFINCVMLIWAYNHMVYESYYFGWWHIQTWLVGPVMWASTFRTQLCEISESFSDRHLGANIIWCVFPSKCLNCYPRFGLWVELVWRRYSYRPCWNYGILVATVGLVPIWCVATCSSKQSRYDAVVWLIWGYTGYISTEWFNSFLLGCVKCIYFVFELGHLL